MLKVWLGFSLPLRVKHQKRDKLKKLLSKKKPEFKMWKICSLSILQRKRSRFQWNSKGVAEQVFDKEIEMGMNHTFN